MTSAADRDALPELVASTGPVAFADVRRLVRAVAPADRARLGVLLDRLDVARVQDAPAHRRVHVTGSGTTAPLVAPLRAQLVAAGVLPVITGGEFGGLVPDLVRDGGQDDVLVVLLDATLVTDRLPSPWDPGDLETAIGEVTELLVPALRAAARHRLVVSSTIALPADVLRSVTAVADRARVARAWRDLDTALLDLGVEADGVVVLDTGVLLTQEVALRDDAFAHAAGLQLSLGLVDLLAREVAHVVRAHAGLARKALVTDLDHTLWGGVLGDDGVQGVVSDPAKGSGYQAYQRLLRQLAHQGVLLAVSSKNDADLVSTALRTRSDVLVEPGTFLTVEAGWDPKSEHMSRILGTLNIGSEAVVLVDDSPFERDEVTSRFPDVRTVTAEGSPAGLVSRVLDEDHFLVLRTTDADRRRAASLRGTIEMGRAVTSGTDLGSYLAGLQQRLQIAPAAPADLPRVAQMTMRTNQFHLVTTRCTQDEVSALAAGPDREVLVVRLLDRLVDHGIVGAVVLQRTARTLVVENMLLSCRVFGREVEHAVVDAVLDAARAAGTYDHVRAQFRRTPRNERFAGFWPECGLRPDGHDGDLQTFVIEIARSGGTPDRHLTTDHTPGRLLT